MGHAFLLYPVWDSVSRHDDEEICYYDEDCAVQPVQHVMLAEDQDPLTPGPLQRRDETTGKDYHSIVQWYHEMPTRRRDSTMQP